MHIHNHTCIKQRWIELWKVHLTIQKKTFKNPNSLSLSVLIFFQLQMSIWIVQKINSSPDFSHYIKNVFSFEDCTTAQVEYLLKNNTIGIQSVCGYKGYLKSLFPKKENKITQHLKNIFYTKEFSASLTLKLS